MGQRSPEKRRHNFYKKFIVSTTNFVDNKVDWDFNSTGFVLFNMSTQNRIVQYSFDGITVDGDLDPKFYPGLVFDMRKENCVFFRLATPGQAVTVRVEAWA